MDNEVAENTTVSINCLPNEIISLILLNNECREILRFGATCKRYNELVNNDRTLWKDRFKHTLTKEVAEIIECKIEDPDWITEVKKYHVLTKNLQRELVSMSPQFYWRTTDVSLEDMRSVYALALSHNLSYYYTIISLQDIIRKGKRTLDFWTCEKPLTLTEMHYAKVALRHLIHTYLCVKWVKQHIKNELSPEIVVNYFVQWIDTDNLYPDEKVTDKIQILVRKVEKILDPAKPSTVQERCTKGLIEPRKIVEAVSQLLYKQWRMAVTPTANVENLNIIKVIDYRCGNPIAVGAIYNAIAKKFGADCDLVSFPNHLYMEWREKINGETNLYTIDLKTGEIHPKRRCPFSEGGAVNHSKYYPDSLLQYIYSMFHMTIMQYAIKNWHTHNALHLLDFLGTDDNAYNPYRNFLTYLLDITHLPAMNMDLDIKYLTTEHIQIISSLSNLNAPFSTVCRSRIVKTHSCNVKYAVGMICYHKKYDYVCIVRGWDFTCAVEWQRRMEIDSLEFGPKQPFYHVIAADQSERYVAQENLVEVTKPSRLYHLEDFIAREFTHFDGFAYVPNEEKKTEYPEEGPIVERYRTICFMRVHATRKLINDEEDLKATTSSTTE